LIVTCRACGARYEFDDGRVPARVLRVRCPVCRAVFRLDGVDPESPDPDLDPELSAPAPEPAAAASEPSPATGSPDVSEPVSGDEPAAGPRELARTRLLARALASDILHYHRARRDEALGADRILAEFTPEIAASWKLIRARSSLPRDRAAGIFREALHEILASGAPLNV